MVVDISSSVLEAILAHAAAVPDREICGLLFGSESRIEAARPTFNVHPDPARAFEIDPVALIAAHKAERAGGARIIGHYHSHPTGSPLPSLADLAGSEAGRLSLIVAAGQAALYRRAADAMLPLALRPISTTIGASRATKNMV